MAIGVWAAQIRLTSTMCSPLKKTRCEDDTEYDDALEGNIATL